jgi:hypothetical protein
MKILGYIFAGLLVVLGLLFVVAAASSGLWPRYVVGGVLLGAGLVLVLIIRSRVPEKKVTLVQKVDVSGDVGLEELRCRQCGGSLDQKSVTVRAGAVFVTCPFCSGEYQIEEAPKW